MDDKIKTLLFKDFPPISTHDWEAKIHEDLKGADYEKRLVWKTTEGIAVRPYYRSEHLENVEHIGSLPGEPPFVRGAKIRSNDWLIRQDFEEKNPEKANALAREAISKGAQAVGLNVENVESAADLGNLLNRIDLEKTTIHLQHGSNYPDLFEQLNTLAASNTLQGSLNFDPLAYYLLYDKFHKSAETGFGRAAKLVNAALDSQPRFHVITINGQHYNHTGASMVQELAFSLSHANEYLAALTDMGLNAFDVARHMVFNFAIGSSYFMEIAKLRAARMLWSRIIDAYNGSASKNEEQQPAAGSSVNNARISSDDAKTTAGSNEGTPLPQMFVHALTSNWNKSIYDPYVNMLRTTTEAMAAAIGGADSICVNAFDNTFKKADAFSYRMARNQQIILKNEAYFNKVADPAAGSYYIEKLTDDMAASAWALFLQLEDMGGFIKSVESGFVRSEIEKTCQKRDMDIAMRKRVFVGTNQYANTSEQMLDKVVPTAKLTDISVLRQYRGPQAFEALRMAVENHAQKGLTIPKVFLFTYGNLAMRKARATFSGNFFGVAGYQIIDNLGFPDIDAGVKAAIASEANIVVFCSSDEEYLAMAPAAQMIKAAKPNTQIVVAGNPKDIMEQLDQAGVDHYIHLRTNVLEKLAQFNDISGII